MIDLLKCDGSCITPLEYKRGEAHSVPAGLYELHTDPACRPVFGPARECK